MAEFMRLKVADGARIDGVRFRPHALVGITFIDEGPDWRAGEEVLGFGEIVTGPDWRAPKRARWTIGVSCAAVRLGEAAVVSDGTGAGESCSADGIGGEGVGDSEIGDGSSESAGDFASSSLLTLAANRCTHRYVAVFHRVLKSSFTSCLPAIKAARKK